MNEFQATAVMAALFALRCIVPFALMLAMAYGMRWLVRYWDRQAAAGPRPSIPLAMAPQAAADAAVPCWVSNHCDEKARAACPAYANQTVACWMAWLLNSGQVREKCAGCAYYTGSPALALAGD